jgi:hypothetical protein
MKFRIFSVTIAALLLLSINAWASYQSNITYDYTQSGANSYTFTLDVHNNATGVAPGRIDQFFVNLDADSNSSNYQNIVWNSFNSPTWGSDALQPGGFGASGNIVAYTQNLGDGIDAGSSLSGFSFSFDYFGTLAPSQQLFSFSADFDTTLDALGNPVPTFSTGFLNSDGLPNQIEFARIPENPGAVPEPSTVLLLGLGLSAMVCLRRKLRL